MGESHTQFEPEHPEQELSSVLTCELVNELAKREGVEEIQIAPDEDFVAANCGRDHDNIIQERGGPARILVVTD